MSIIRANFSVTGMTCASCASSVESMLGAQQGVSSAAVNFAAKSATVDFDSDIVSEKTLIECVKSIGYGLISEKEKEKAKVEEERYLKKLRTNTLYSGLFSVPLVIIGMFFMDMPYANQIMWVLSTPVLVIWGRDFFINALKQLKHKKTNMDTLVALSTGIAYLFSVFNTLYPEFWHARGQHAHVYFESSAVIIFFILLGKTLEENAKNRTSDAIKKLMGMQPKTVSIINADNSVATIKIEEIQTGHLILVKPGEKIAVDGEVIDGESYVDESMISGEPLSVLKSKGSKAYSGTLNQKGTFKLRAVKVGSETLLAQIIQTVQQAQGSKAPVQKLTDKIASVFVPVVMAVSILAFILWLIFGGQNGFTQGLISMITVLVIACPCALGLATPTALMVGIGKGANEGILIKDAEALESAGEINTVVLDKTGTITIGKPTVSKMFFSAGSSNTDLLKSIFYGIEIQSEHPLAVAICNYFKSEGVNPTVIDKSESITGKGIIAEKNATQYYTGNMRLMKEKDVNITESEQKIINELEENAQSIVVFAAGTNIIAIAGVSDKIKDTSAKAIQFMQQKGIEVLMLTGDNEKAANAVARQVGITNVLAHLMPSDKAIYIDYLKSNGKKVAMIGDGINDSEALAKAHVSFAMGKGSDIAMDVAKVTIMSSDLLLIPKAIELSKQTVSKIKQNLFWAFIYNLIGIPVAAGALYFLNGFMLNPMLAGAAMAMSSVSVVTNSLLLKYKKL